MVSKKFKVGDLVRVKIRSLREDRCLNFFATVIKCRYKTDIYYVHPANSPLSDKPYWLEGSWMERVGQEESTHV